jgi:hypothetical protein
MVPINKAVDRAKKCADSIHSAIAKKSLDAFDKQSLDAYAAYAVMHANAAANVSFPNYVAASHAVSAANCAAYTVAHSARAACFGVADCFGRVAFNNAIIAELENQLEDIRDVLKEGQCC